MAVEISFSFGGVDTLGELAIWLITIPVIVIYIVRASRQFALFTLAAVFFGDVLLKNVR